MTKPLWRKWFSRYTRAAYFFMREFFSFIKNVFYVLNKTPLFKKLVLIFKNTTASISNKSKGLVVSSIFIFIIFGAVVIFFATTAKAEKEVHAYITPSLVSGEGFENMQAVALQDLSIDARVVDFTAEISARVAFGSFAQTVKESVVNDTTVVSSSSTDSSLEASSTIEVLDTSAKKTEITTEEKNITPVVETKEESATGTVSFIKNNLKLFTKNIFGVKTVIAQESAPSATSDEPSADNVPTPTPTPTVTIAPDTTKETTNTKETEVTPKTEQASNENTGEVSTDTSITETPKVEEVKIQNEDRDPFKVASCTTFNKQCHIVVLEGFGVGEELSKYPVKSAQLMLSLAGHAAPSDNPDRLVVRVYRNGRWDFLSEQVIRGEFDNAMRGGYISLPLSLDSWSELASMIVAVEYVREGESDSMLLLDAAWVDVGFAAEESPDDLALYSPNVKNALLARDAERRARERDHLDLGNGKILDFTNTMAELPSSKLRVATTKSKHSVLGSGEEYFSVTNFSSSAERVHLSFHFPEDGGRVKEISHYSLNSPHKVVESKTSPIAYFCAAGWNVSTSTDETIVDKSYTCDETKELHLCSSLNDDKTNCISEVTSIGKEETTVFRRDFEQDAIFSGSFSEKQSFIGKAIDSMLSDMPENILPASVKEVSYSNSFDIEPGTTKYFRIGFDTPINTRGDIYIEAAADSGAYGLAHTEFDGSWNWRIPVDIGLPYSGNNGETAVPISLNKMPLEFWNNVEEGGTDIRFSDEDGSIELPFWVSNFNKNTRHGLVWVRMPVNAGIMPRVFLYAGNSNATKKEEPWAPFTTSILSDRAVLVGKSGEDVSVQITALAPHVRVSIEDGEERSLLYGETALFEDVKNASIIRSTGPISARANSVFSRAVAVPFGAAGMDVGLSDGALELAMTPAGRASGVVSFADETQEIKPNVILRTPISEENSASSSIPTIFVAENETESIVLSDKKSDERMALSSSVILDKPALGVRATCDGDRYFGAYDARGSFLATTTCNKVLSGPFDEGTLVRLFSSSSTSPFSAVFSAVYNGDESTLLGRDTNARSSDGYDPEIAFGAPEYVVPGEHRIFDLEIGKDKPHVTRFLSKKREFAAEEVPTFRFQYKPQSSSFFRTLRSLVGIPPFKVDKVVVEQSGQPTDIKTSIEYSGNFEWIVRLDKEDVTKIAPGKLTLRMIIKEGVSDYEDSYDFYWGLLAVNFNKAVYESGETADIYLGALSESGNTVCDAKLKLFVTNSASSTQEVEVTPSGKCDGNNIIDVPDYTAKYTPVDNGLYSVRLIRLDEEENVLAEVRDQFTVVSRQQYIIERSGPTRINPISPYNMTLRVVAREDYEGKITERIPADFEIIERGGSTLTWADEAHTAKIAEWDVKMKAGEVYQYTYRFDAPDKSPFIYFLGPAKIGSDDNGYTEPRKWMIASDLAGKMIIYWANGLIPPPANWDCISCGGRPDNTLLNKWAMGSSTYGIIGGSSTHQPAVTASISSAVYGTPGLVGNGGTALVYKDHTHTFTATVSSGDHKPPSRSLKAYKNNNAGEQSIPAGAILLFESAPSSGWTVLSAMEGYYPYGAASPDVATGTVSHLHNVTGTTGAPVGGGAYASNNRGTAVANSTHTHTANAVSTNSVLNNPPYVTYIMASSDSAQSVPNGAISMWDADPAPGWINLSGEGGVLSGKFVKIDPSAGSTGGSDSHIHADQLGLSTGAAVGVTRVPNGAADPFGSPASHTHTIDYTSYTETTNLPPFATVIFAKRSVGIPEFSQEDFRFYNNVNDPEPTDPWPANEVDVEENMAIEDVGYRIKPGNTFRVRMSARVSNATSTIGLNQFKLQYSNDNICAAALNWNDVGAPGSSSPLRGYDNNLVNHGATLINKLLSTSTASALQYYSESESPLSFVREAGLGTISEFDWVLNANTNLASSSRYCLRMVGSDGKVFGEYNKFPSFLSNSAPSAPSLDTQFNHAKLMSLTPTLTFSSSDEEGNSMHYAVEIDNNADFSSPEVSKSTTNASSHFTNLTNPSNKAPYTNADSIQYQVQAGSLTNGTTYWWRVRAVDPTGSTQYGDWSVSRAFTIDTSLATSAWFQTTDAQFLQNDRNGVSVSSNFARLAAGSTTGVMYSPEVVFNEGPFGSVWGSLNFVDDGGSGITYQVEYKDSSDTWDLVPDSVLTGNSSGFGTTPQSLTAIDPLYYPVLRLRANFTNSGVPALDSWGITWAYKTLAPILYSEFNHAKVSTTTPTISFAATDPLSRTITYEVQYSSDPTFATQTTCNSGAACAAGFKNLTTAGNLSPFTSTNLIQFKFQTALTNGTTYFWRTRAYGTGGGAWSFWSESRAFTVDTSANVYPTWHQTMRGQFNMDTLSGLYANSGNSVAVATTSDKVLVAYGKGSDSKPKYRLYESGALSGEKDMLSIGSTLLWSVTRASLANDQFIVGTMGSNRSIKMQVFENGIWSRMFTFPQSGPSAQRRSFDISFESESGRALAVSCNGKNADYAIFDGSSWGEVQTLTLGYTNNCELVKMASSPTQNQIIALFRDTGAVYHAEVWNGSSWMTGASRFNFNTTNAGIVEPAHDGMAIEYERASGRALAVVSRKATRGFVYRMWDGSSWGTESTSNSLGSNTAAQFEWGNLKKDPASNNLMLCAVAQYAVDDDGAFTNFVRWNAATSAFVANKLGQYYPYTRHAQSLDCAYETKVGRTGRLMEVGDESWQVADGSTTANATSWDALTVASSAWQSGISTTDRRYNYSGTTYNWNASETWTSRVERASISGDILAIGLARNTLNYVFKVWNGSTWTAPQTLAASSVSTKPFGQPFDMASQEGFNQGRIFSQTIDFADGNAPAWREARFSTTKPVGTEVLISVEYLNGSDWLRIPDDAIPGNSTGTATSPINLRNVNSQTYNKIRMRADLTCNGLSSCPVLNDWTVEWTEGLTISGFAAASNRTTRVSGGTVKIAVNGIEQTGKTAIVDGAGNWSISGVNYKTGEAVTAWIDNPIVSNRAVAVVKFAGAGSLSNVELSRKWLTLGDSGQAGQIIENADIKLFDNNNEAGVTRPDLFFNVDASENLSVCNTGNCADFSVAVVSGTTWRPKASSATTNTMYSLTIDGSVSADANTFKLGGNWMNSGSFSPATSNVIFNATSSVHTVDNTGAALFKFNNVTFGEANTPAVWQLITPLYVNGNLSINYGTLSQLAQNISIEKNLAIGANGVFTKGTATTTFLGSAVANWTDLTVLGQDMGNVSVNGSPKQLSLSTAVKATNIQISVGDTIAFGVNTLTLAGNFTNNGIVLAGSGKLVVASASSAVIKQGGYALNNITLQSGNVSWSESNATSTGDIIISGGNVTFPTNTFAIAGSLTQTAGTFISPSAFIMNAVSPGKQISVISNLGDISFVGTGSWNLGINATSTGNVNMKSGTVIMPSGTFTVAGNFINNGSNINSNNGTLRMTGVYKNITLGGAILSGITAGNGSNISFTEMSATTTGSVIAESLSNLILPSSSITIGGSLINNGTIDPNASTVYMNRASGAATISAGTMIVSSLHISGNGNFTIAGNARISANFTLGTVGSFTMQNGYELRVDGFFTNSAINANTTWTGSTLRLTSGATMTSNTKQAGGDDYENIILDTGTQLRTWNSSATSVVTNGLSSLYAQNWAGTSGLLRIYGIYQQNAGTAFWNYAKDFDGTALTAGNERAVSVSVQNGSVINFATSSALEIIGDVSFGTTLNSLAGTFSLNFASSTLSVNYADISGIGSSGINMSGSSSISQFNDVKITTTGGSAITLSRQVVEANNGKQFYRDVFDGPLGAKNITVTSAASGNANIRFKQHSGSIDGEAYDADINGGGDPGEIRWDDSNFEISIAGVVYNSTPLPQTDASVCDGVTPVVSINVSGGYTDTVSCSETDGSFTFSNVRFTGDTTMTFYLSGVSQKAVTITRGASVDIPASKAIKLIEGRVMVRHEDVLPMTIAKLSSFDSDDNATDIPFTANGGNLTVQTGFELWVASSTTFAPGGNVTTGSEVGGASYSGKLHIDNFAKYLADGSEQINVGGDFVIDSSGSFVSASSTVIFNPSSVRTITSAAGPVTFNNVRFMGSATTSLISPISIEGNFDLASGGIIGSQNITAKNDVTGDGTLAMTGGTFTMLNGGLFGGSKPWSLYNFILGDGSSFATTTKNGVATTTVRGVMTVRGNHHYDMNGKPLILSGAGNVLVPTGSINTSNATIRYSPATNSNVANIEYGNLAFAGAGTSTLPSMNLIVNGDFTVGGVGSTAKVDGNKNNPTLSIGGDVTIETGAKLIGSSSGLMTVGGDWINRGIFINSSGKIVFNGSGSKIIDAGNSAFGNISFSDEAGSWTLSQNATATSLLIGSSTSFTLAPSKTLEITGNFQNLVGGSATTWTGSTLYLNTGTRDEVNTKIDGSDTYDQVRVGSLTQAIFWNSSSTAFTTVGGGGVLSQNHAGINGDLYIFGNYVKNTGSEYWNYLKDFDGEILSFGDVRAPRIRFAPNATATYGGTSILEVVGKSTATTTIDSISGTYGLSIRGASTTMQYADFSNINSSGLQLLDSVKVGLLDDVIFKNPAGVGTMVTIAGSVITANPLFSAHRNAFIANGGNNVTVTGSPLSAWWFLAHFGGRDGESYDSDPAGNPGYVIWDDSEKQFSIMGKVFESDKSTVSSLCDGISQNIHMKIEGAGIATSACDSNGNYRFDNILTGPNDTIAIFASSTGSEKAVGYAYRPKVMITDFNLYENTVIVRNEQLEPLTNASIALFDKTNNAKIPADSNGGVLTLDSNTRLIVWSGKTFAPGGNVIVGGNTNISPIDGDVELMQNSIWSTSGAEQYTIGGDFILGNNANILGSSGEFIFTSAVLGKSVSASTPASISNINFNGAGGWTISGFATTTGNFRIQQGSVNLPNAPLYIGGDFNNQSVFNSNSGTLLFTASTSGKQIRSNGNSFGNITFLGTGAWSFLDSATTTGNLLIASGTPTLPSGMLSVGGDFENIAGSFNSNNGSITVRGSGSRKFVPGGSSFNNLRIENGDYVTNMLNATSTGDVTIASGKLDLPVENFAIRGSFRNSGAFVAGATSTVRMYATTTGKIINPGSSEFNNLIIDGAGGGFTIEANATVAKTFTIKAANAFVQSPATKLTVKDIFTNKIGGTWTGSTLRLEKMGTSTMNAKTDGLVAYNNIELGPNVQLSSWKSSFSNVAVESGAYLYSQNDNNVNGSLRIYGNYVRSSGRDYWSSKNDFDGTSLGAAARAVSVRIAGGASASYINGAELYMVGESSRITSVQSISGTYSLEVNSGKFNGNYFKLRNTTSSGLQLLGTTTIMSLDNADLATGVDSGRIITMDAGVVDMNTGSTFSNDSFALDSGHTSGVNIYLNGTTNNAITITNHFGGLNGEAYDSDGASACGAFRWDDSSCQFIDQRYYRWRNDDGNESVPDSEWFGGSASGWTHRQRVHVVNNTTSAATDIAVKVVLNKQSEMQSDFRDIRFTDSGGVTTTPHWIEKYSTANAVVWVKVPSIAARSSSDVYVYYGNSLASTTSNGSNTFSYYFFDAESGISGMTGDTTKFAIGAAPALNNGYTSLGSNMLKAGVLYEQDFTATGMADMSTGITGSYTVRGRMYLDFNSDGYSDDTCVTFGNSGSVGTNYAYCISTVATEARIRIARNATRGGRDQYAVTTASDVPSTEIFPLDSSARGWYDYKIDRTSTGNMTAKLYGPNGDLISNLSSTDNTNGAGSGVGYTFWYQRGGFDDIRVSSYLPEDPTALVLTPQQHGGASWKASENTAFMTASQNETMRVRFGIRNTGTTLNSQQLRLDYAVKGSYSNCESVPDENYSPVPTVASCGSSHICMTTSSNFADNDATTPLLSTPKGLSFISGRMVESPSNSTPGYTIPANTFTEVEYAMKFTSSAMQPGYCMRVSNDGERLVSYTKVAEAAVLQAPGISNLAWNASPIYLLNEGTTTRVYATGTVTDFNGASDMVMATGSIYRTGVLDGVNCTENGDNCYSGTKTSCSLIDCLEFSCTLSCYADLQYYAERTDYGDFASEQWMADVTVRDSQNLSDRDSVGAELMELKALSLDQSNINYGDIEVGSSTSGLNPKITLQNTGNSSYSLILDGSDLTAAGSVIPVNNQMFATSTFAMTSCLYCSIASSTPQDFGLTLSRPNSTNPIIKSDLYWGIQIPNGTKAMMHSGAINISTN